MSDARPTKTTPVDYAENSLGVHEVYKDSLKVNEELAQALEDYREQATVIRRTHDDIELREYELASEVRSGEPSISQEALKRAIKDCQHTDDVLVSLRARVREAQDKQEAAHALIEMNKYRLRTLSARMNELGGLLAFYAAAKSSSKPPAR